MISDDDILNANILIVDDQPANVQLLEQMLREFGYQNLTSTMDPHAVCALYRAHHYDLIPVSYTHLTLPTNREV